MPNGSRHLARARLLVIDDFRELTDQRAGNAGIGLVMLAPIVIGLLAHLIGAEWGRLIYMAAVYAIFAFGEMIPLVLNNYTFMFFTVAGLALAAPHPNPQLWLLMEAAGGGLLIGATIVVGRILRTPSAAEAAH
jgi:hypothetical protein